MLAHAKTRLTGIAYMEIRRRREIPCIEIEEYVHGDNSDIKFRDSYTGRFVSYDSALKRLGDQMRLRMARLAG